MSRDFSKISPKVWRSRRFKALATDDARYFMIFLITSPHQTSAGCFHMLDAYAAADLGWTVERMIDARTLVAAAELIVFDEATEEYFINGWFAFNRPMNVSHQTSIVRRVEALESELVREVAEAELQPVIIPSTKLQAPASPSNNLTNTAFINRRANG